MNLNIPWYDQSETLMKRNTERLVGNSLSRQLFFCNKLKNKTSGTENRSNISSNDERCLGGILFGGIAMNDTMFSAETQFFSW